VGLREYAKDHVVDESTVEQAGLLWTTIGVASLLIPLFFGLEGFASSNTLLLIVGVGILPVSLLIIAVGLNAYYSPHDILPVL
jgi:hypothetical protein